MFWSKDPPTNFPDYRCKVQISSIKREQLNAKSLAIVGERSSGKSSFLAKSIIHKSNKENALVLCTFATERKFWTNIIQTYGITKTVIHTPDSLARYLLSLWAKKEGKKIEWILDKDAQKTKPNKTTQGWRDEKSYALWLLKSNKMTAGIAHWLLSNEIENFIENKMLPNLDIFCVDEPEEWEFETEKWVKLLPRTRTIVATKSKSNLWEEPDETKFMHGSYDWMGQLANYRYIKLSPSLPEQPNDHSCIICQDPFRTKILKETYKAYDCEVRKAEQIKGRRYKELYIDSLPYSADSIPNWGNKSKTLDYLDLIASRGKSNGVLTNSNQNSYLPTRNKEEKFLVWAINPIEKCSNLLDNK